MVQDREAGAWTEPGSKGGGERAMNYMEVYISRRVDLWPENKQKASLQDHSFSQVKVDCHSKQNRKIHC